MKDLSLLPPSLPTGQSSFIIPVLFYPLYITPASRLARHHKKKRRKPPPQQPNPPTPQKQTRTRAASSLGSCSLPNSGLLRPGPLPPSFRPYIVWACGGTEGGRGPGGNSTETEACKAGGVLPQHKAQKKKHFFHFTIPPYMLQLRSIGKIHPVPA